MPSLDKGIHAFSAVYTLVKRRARYDFEGQVGMKREGMDGRMGKGNTAGGCDIAGIVLFLLAGTAFG